MSALFTILCVDDETSVLLTVKMMLERAGFLVITASSAAEALNAIASEKIDAAVLGYAMPNMNGIQLAQRIKTLRPELPIFFLSAFQELPGETLGLAEAWIKKGEADPEQWVSKLKTIAGGATRSSAMQAIFD